MTKGCVYYSDGHAPPEVLAASRRTIESSGLPVVVVALHAPVTTRFSTWGSAKKAVFVFGERGAVTMFRQILAGLEALDTDVAFLCEHDILYHPSHFQFDPPRPDVFFYNLNTWKVRAADGHAIHYRAKQTSGLCANRELLIAHYRKRIALCEAVGFTRKMGFEPGSHARPERVDDVPSGIWWSAFPNIDIRHDRNLTESRWDPAQFRDPTSCEGWTEADAVPGWGVTKGRFSEFLQEVACVASV